MFPGFVPSGSPRGDLLPCLSSCQRSLRLETTAPSAVHAQSCVYPWTCMHVCARGRVYMLVHAHVHARTQVCVCSHVCVYMVHTHVQAHVYVCTYRNLCACAHESLHAYTYTRVCSCVRTRAALGCACLTGIGLGQSYDAPDLLTPPV